MNENLPPPSRPGRIGARVALGGVILIGSSLTGRLLALVGLAFLGRLLTPADFGIVALAMIAVGLSEAVSNRQFEAGLIRTQDPDDRHYGTAFALALLWGLAASLILFFAAGPFARLMSAPEVGDALRWLSPLPLIRSLRNPHFVNFEKGLSYMPSAMRDAGGRAATTVVSVGLAFLWGSYWAIVAGMLTGAVVQSALTWSLRRSIPRLSLVYWRQFLGFGGWLSGSGVLSFLSRRADTLVIGAYMPTALVGQYNMGYEMSLMTVQRLTRPLQRALFPGLAALSHEPERLRSAYVTAQSALLTILMPLSLILALAAEEIVWLVVGPQWDVAASALQVLAPTMSLTMLTAGVTPLVMVQGDTRRFFLRNLAILAITMPMLIGSVAYYGFEGALFARVVVTLVSLVLTLQIVSSAIGRSYLSPIYASWRSLMSALAMIAATLVLASQLGETTTDAPAAIVAFTAKAALGLGVYIATLLVLWLAAGRPDGAERRVIGLLGKAGGKVRKKLRRRFGGGS